MTHYRKAQHVRGELIGQECEPLLKSPLEFRL
jgi:hypothetical protein